MLWNVQLNRGYKRSTFVRCTRWENSDMGGRGRGEGALLGEEKAFSYVLNKFRFPVFPVMLS